MPWISFGAEVFYIIDDVNTFGIKIPVEFKFILLKIPLVFLITVNPLYTFTTDLWGFSMSFGLRWFIEYY